MHPLIRDNKLDSFLHFLKNYNKHILIYAKKKTEWHILENSMHSTYQWYSR
jgi:hypothetical protein